jgi:hypothetical protein
LFVEQELERVIVNISWRWLLSDSVIDRSRHLSNKSGKQVSEAALIVKRYGTVDADFGDSMMECLDRGKEFGWETPFPGNVHHRLEQREMTL